MTRRFECLGTLCLLCLISLYSPLQAQTAALATKSTGPHSYYISEEITLTGTVSSVLTKPATGMTMGAHLLLATSSGQVDASLGRFALMGKGALTVAAGQIVAVTGVMKTIKARPVFLVRSLKAGNSVYVIRNEHGFAISPQGRQRVGQKAAQKWESL